MCVDDGQRNTHTHTNTDIQPSHTVQALLLPPAPAYWISNRYVRPTIQLRKAQRDLIDALDNPAAQRLL